MDVETMHKRVDEQLPEAKEKFEAFAAKALGPGGELEPVTKELIAIAVASAARNERVKAVHWEKAKELGATDEQITEALSVLWAQAGGTQVFWMKDDLAELLGSHWRNEFIPETDRGFWAFKRELFADGAISEKTKNLVAVAVNSQLRCRHCTVAYVQAAIKSGASKAEVAEALGVLWAVASEAEIG